MASSIVTTGGVSTILVQPGPPGTPGKGVPAGGTTGQYLRKKSNDDFDGEWVTGGAGGGAADASELPFDDSGMEHIEGNSVQDALESIDAQLGATGGGAVDSVNGQTGVVVLEADDIGETSTAKIMTGAERTKLAALPENSALTTSLSGKVDKITGKGLSTNDLTDVLKTKLDGIASGATANDTNANLRDRTTHTGVQAISTVDGLQTALDGKAAQVHTHTASQITDFSSAADARIAAQAGQNSGLATLDAGGKVPTSQLPSAALGALSYQGSWNASTNSPALASGTGTKGHYYVVTTAGSTNLDGEADWKVKDWATYNGTAWEKIDNTETVTSVNGATGAVVLDTDDVAEGSTNQYFTTERAQDAVGNALVDSGTVDFNYDDSTNQITATVKDGSVDMTKVGSDVVAAIDSKVTTTVEPYDISEDLMLWIEPAINSTGWGDDMSGQPYVYSDLYRALDGGPVVMRRSAGKMAMLFDATNYYRLPSIEQVLPLTFYIAVNQTGSASGTKILVNSSAGPVIQLIAGKPNVTWGAVNFTHSTAVSGWTIITVTITASAVKIALNGATAETTSHSEVTLGDWITLGHKSYLGHMGSVILFNDEITGTDDAKTIARLKKVFGIV